MVQLPHLFTKDFVDASESLFLLEVADSARFRYREVNLTHARLLGRAPADLVGVLVEDSMPAAMAEPFLAVCLQCVGDGRVVEEAIELNLPTGPQSFPCLLVPLRDNAGRITQLLGLISGCQQAADARLEHLRFLEGMDRVNRVILGTRDLETMMRALLDTVLDLFECDRAFLMFPCDPDSATWLVPYERTRPEYPGAQALRQEVPMDSEVARKLRVLLAADGPVAFGPDLEHPLPAVVAERYGFRSLLSMAISPRQGKPWEFGLQQCSSARVWTQAENHLLQEIGRRLADGLSSLLAVRDLRANESLYRSLVNAMAEGVIFHGAGGEIIAANPAAAKLFDLPAEELRGMKMTVLAALTVSEEGLPFPDDSHPIRELFRSGEPHPQLTMGIPHRDGTTVWVAVNSQPLTTPGLSRPYAAVTTLHDITERKRAEELVRKREQEFFSLAENMPDNFSRHGLDGRMTYCNPSLAALLGLTDELRVEGGAFVEYFDAREHEEYLRAVKQVVASGETLELEVPLPDGKSVHLIRFAPERDESGRIVGVIAIGRDITEYKAAQARLRAQADSLAETNSALKVLLNHSQQAESEIKKKCLTNIETLILPYLDQLRRVGLSPTGRLCVDLIHRNLQGLAISSMSKLSSPVLGLTPREVMVADLIRKDYASKDIAELLCLSAGTVEAYRDQIREKLGLKNKKVNLRSYLRSHFNE